MYGTNKIRQQQLLVMELCGAPWSNRRRGVHARCPQHHPSACAITISAAVPPKCHVRWCWVIGRWYGAGSVRGGRIRERPARARCHQSLRQVKLAPSVEKGRGRGRDGGKSLRRLGAHLCIFLSAALLLSASLCLAYFARPSGLDVLK